MPDLDRALPSNVDAERSILGAMLINNDAIYGVAARLKRDDFYLDAHRILFDIIIDLTERSIAADLITVAEAITSAGKLEEIGGIAYLFEVVDGIPSLLHIEHYLVIVRDKSIARHLIHLTNKIMAECFDQFDTGTELLKKAENSVYALAETQAIGGLVPTSEASLDAIRYFEKLFNDKLNLTGLATGFIDLDALTSGFQRGDLLILAARPGAGKTALAVNIASHVAISDRKTVAIFSIEMTRVQLMVRMACGLSEVDSQKIRTGFMNSNEFLRLIDAMQKISKAPLMIDDASKVTMMDIRGECRRTKTEKGLELVIIDYLGLISSTGRAENRVQEVSQITRALKGLAKELDIPVLCLCQLNRSPENRKGDQMGRPQLSDLRESGSIENDADVVMFIYREEMYKATDDNRGQAELIVAKQRNGPTGIVRLVFKKEHTQFLSMGYKI